MRRPCFAMLTGAAVLAATILTAKAAGAQQVVYYGGRVISNVEVVEVAWTGGVDPTYMTNLSGFYSAIVTSSFIDWLTEYDTIGKTGYTDGLPGSNQHIGRGTFGGSYVITPANTQTSILDSDIQAELAAQLDAGALPPPKKDAGGNVNTLYMIDFPPGYSISLLSIQSCQQFGAYHFTMKYGGDSVPYGVHPNCGYDFDTSTIVHAHELAEAITDMEVGLVDQDAPTARPIAWVTIDNTAWGSFETADLCQGTSEQVAGFVVQKVWSNYASACVAQIPICDGTIAPPACRPCNAFDSGNACSGAKPACATAGPEAGKCVTCTTAYPAACTGETPVCDESIYTCVGCLENADCKSPDKPVCDTATTTCRACKSDAECSDGVCDLSGDADEGQCVDCNGDEDCAAEERCEDHACAPLYEPDAGASGGHDGGGTGSNESVAEDDSGCACRTSPDAWPEGRRGSVAWLAAAMLTAAAGVRRRRRG